MMAVAIYMGMRIASGALDYAYVISKRPDLKDGIDNYLIDNGQKDLIVHSA